MIAKVNRGTFLLVLIFMAACGTAYAEGQAEDFVKQFQAHCVETDGDAELIDNLMVLEKWEEQPQELVKVGQAESSQNPRGFMTKKDGQIYLINYSRDAGCGLISQGPSGLDVLRIVKKVYKVADFIETEEGFQRTVMMVLRPDSLYAGSIIVVAFLPSEPGGVVSLAYLPKELADTVR